MPPRRGELPFQFLETASERSLESYELSRLGHASDLRREIAELIDRWLDEAAAALLARLLLENRRLLRQVRSGRGRSPANSAATTDLALNALVSTPRRVT